MWSFPIWRRHRKHISTVHASCIRNKLLTLPSRFLRCRRMPSYDASHFDPPAPVAQVTLRNSHSGATVSDVRLLIDTGADITLLPRTAVEQLGVPILAGQQYELRGSDRSTSFALVVMLDLLFLQRAFRGRYLLTEEDRGIMGRDILNHVMMLLDGPHQQWLEQGP